MICTILIMPSFTPKKSLGIMNDIITIINVNATILSKSKFDFNFFTILICLLLFCSYLVLTFNTKSTSANNKNGPIKLLMLILSIARNAFSGINDNR